MIKRLTITKQDVIDWCRYGTTDSISYLGQNGDYRSDNVSRYEIRNLPDILALKSITGHGALGGSSKLGLFEVIQRRQESGYATLLLPKDIVKEEEVPGFFEMAKAYLDKEMPDRYCIIGNNLYIHYPEITITNTVGEVHTMYNLVIKLVSNDSGLTISILSGKKYSYSAKELMHNYVHSHLQPSPGNWCGFCMGTTPFNNFYQHKFQTNPTEQNFGMFLAQLDSYLVWESLEGRPYKSINDLRDKGTQHETTGSNWGTASAPVKTLIAKAIIAELTPDMLFPVDEYYVVSPYLHDTALFEIEQKVTKLIPAGTTLYDYDKKTNKYVNLDSRQHSLPVLTGEDKQVIAALKITPRMVVGTEKDEEVELIKRFSQYDLTKILEQVNELLLNAQKVNDGENRTEAQS